MLILSLILLLIYTVNGGAVIGNKGTGWKSDKQSKSPSRTCSKATAEFKNGESGVQGFIIVNQDGAVMIDLDLSNLDTSACKEEGKGGFPFHIHTKWDYDTLTEKSGATACGSDYTGPHFNPYGVGVCSALATDEEIDYFNCEVGDLSGRFGNIVAGSSGRARMKGVVASRGKCNARLTPEAVAGKSVVVHCSDGGPKLFCAPFQITLCDADRGTDRAWKGKSGYNDKDDKNPGRGSGYDDDKDKGKSGYDDKGKGKPPGYDDKGRDPSKYEDKGKDNDRENKNDDKRDYKKDDGKTDDKGKDDEKYGNNGNGNDNGKGNGNGKGNNGRGTGGDNGKGDDKGKGNDDNRGKGDGKGPNGKPDDRDNGRGKPDAEYSGQSVFEMDHDIFKDRHSTNDIKYLFINAGISALFCFIVFGVGLLVYYHSFLKYANKIKKMDKLENI